MKNTFHRPLALTTLLCCVLLAACQTAAQKKDSDPPAKLTKIQPTATVKKIWSASLGGGNPKLRLGLDVALDGNVVYSASHKGEIAAFDLNTGKRLWETKTKLPLTGGPGAGQGLVVAGASHGDVVALDAATGAVKWKLHVNSEILSAPAISSDFVLLRVVDGRLLAINSTDGKIVWIAEEAVPRLSLRGTGAPAIAKGLAISGFDNGRMLAINLSGGTTAWEAAVAPPSGRTELERLVDIDSTVKIVDDDVYAVSFQGRVARLAVDTGQVWWTRDISSYRGLATDEDGVYVSSAQGSVVKIGRRTGVELWKQEVLKNRKLSGPAVLGKWVVVGDYKGFVHFLDGGSGKLAARESSGGDRISAPPVASGNVVVVVNEKGKMTAFRVDEPKG
jgi:outer membrane protein assembly factor BamB